jgi:cytosine/adenosine deaminase-related metal-dependent hydrolase
MIIRARSVVTMDGAPIDDGAVVVTGNRIADVGPWAALQSQRDQEIVDLGDHVLLPGLINAHCHLDYTVLRGVIPQQDSFSAWIGAINARKSTLTAEDYLRSIREGFAEAAAFGTTTLANLEAYPELLDQMNPPPIRTWWFAEMIDVRAAVSAGEMHELLRDSTAGDGWRGGIGLAPHAPYTASAQLYANAAATAAANNLPLTTHLAESAEEMQMFRDRTGPLFDFLESIGRPMDDCGERTPLALLRHLLDERWIVAHLNELTADDFQLLERGPRFHIVHCPRSHAYFRHSAFALPRLRALRFNICIGTDSLATNENLSLFAEMRELSRAQPSLSARDILEMATINAAAALGQQHVLGRIRRGYLADMIALPFLAQNCDCYGAILRFEGAVPWLMIDGNVY